MLIAVSVAMAIELVELASATAFLSVTKNASGVEIILQNLIYEDPESIVAMIALSILNKIKKRDSDSCMEDE